MTQWFALIVRATTVMNTVLTNSHLKGMEQVVMSVCAIAENVAEILDFTWNLNILLQNQMYAKGSDDMKLIKTLTAIILAEIAIAIPILVGIYVWSMVAFV
jgi:hypothetical protein